GSLEEGYVRLQPRLDVRFGSSELVFERHIGRRVGVRAGRRPGAGAIGLRAWRSGRSAFGGRGGGPGREVDGASEDADGRSELVERGEPRRESVEPFGQARLELAILGLDEGGDLLEEDEQRRSEARELVAIDRGARAGTDDRVIERRERGVVLPVGVEPLLRQDLQAILHPTVCYPRGPAGRPAPSARRPAVRRGRDEARARIA